MCYTSHLCWGCFMLLNPTRVVLLINKCRHGDDIKMAVIVLLLYTCDYSAVATFPPSFLPFLPPCLSSNDWTFSSYSLLFCFLFFLLLSSLHLPPHTPQHTTPPPPTGWEVLEPASEKQRGSEALAGRPATEGEPDLSARGLPGARERRPSPGGGRHEERAGPLQEHHQQVREPARRLVRRRTEAERAGGESEMRQGYKATQQQQHFSWSGESGVGGGWRRSAVSTVRHRAQTPQASFSARAVLQDVMTGKHSSATVYFPSLTLFVDAALLNPHTVLYHHLVTPRQLYPWCCAYARCRMAFLQVVRFHPPLWPVQTGCWIHNMPVKSHFLSSRHGHKPEEVRCVIFLFSINRKKRKHVYFWTGQEGKTSPAKRRTGGGRRAGLSSITQRDFDIGLLYIFLLAEVFRRRILEIIFCIFYIWGGRGC